MRPSASPRIKMDTEIERLLQIGRQGRQHGNAAADMKAADHHRQTAWRGTGAPDRARADIGSTARPISPTIPPPAARMRFATAATSTTVLHSSQASTSISTSGPSTRSSGTLFDQPVYARQTVRGQGRAQPLDDIAIRVVMRWLDQDDPKGALGRASGQNIPSKVERRWPQRHCGRLAPICVLGCRFATNTWVRRLGQRGE